jgi:uncharacterized protein YjiS (DUF1127 family)
MIGHLPFWKSLSRERPLVAIDIDGLVGGPLRQLATFISKGLQRRAERRRLLSLDDHMLKDIGVSRCDVEREIRRGWFN